jgi:hypothetical protein
MPPSNSAAIRHDVTDDELELPVEEVAARLGLPASMLIRRIEAGDIPARRIDDHDGAHYWVRIADLGTSSRAVLPAGASAPFTAHSESDEIDDVDHVQPPDADTSPQAGDQVATAAHAAQQPVDTDVDAEQQQQHERDFADAVPPPPVRGTVELTPLDREGEGPRAELAMMALDPRELVAGLLDRWERTLEQRIYAEQRQRFEAELTNRQAKVKQLQLELDAARAEHAAALAGKERVLAEKERDLARRERDIEALRHHPRRGWFSRR